MRNFWFGVSLAVLAVTPALADDSVMSTRYGNTEVVENTLGEGYVYFNPDHTFTGKGNALIFHAAFKGTWKIDGGTICLTYESPPPGESNPSCAPIEAHNVGDTWDSNGRKVTLVKGIKQ
jgi:hypothetical protein